MKLAGKALNPESQGIVLTVKDYDEVIVIKNNGDFYYKGNLVTNDKDVYIKFKEWLYEAAKGSL